MKWTKRPYIADFIEFCRAFASALWVSRTVIGALLALLIILSWVLTLAEPLGFGDSLYLSFITALTIGYGDFVPVTVLGKIVCVVTGYIGLIFIGLNVAVATIAVKETLSVDEAHKQTTNNRRKKHNGEV